MDIIITKEDHDKLSAELGRLKSEERPKVSRDLKEAIAQGDLSENAAYDEAKDRQAGMERRIKEIQEKLASAKIIESVEGSDRIVVGSRFVVLDQDTGKKKSFFLVGTEAAAPLVGKISFDSPIGEAFLGKSKDELVEVVTPSGKKRYKVLEIT